MIYLTIKKTKTKTKEESEYDMGTVFNPFSNVGAVSSTTTSQACILSGQINTFRLLPFFMSPQ